MIQVPLALAALGLTFLGVPGGPEQDDADIHEALADIAPQWLEVVVASDPNWVSTGVVDGPGPFIVVSTHQVVQPLLREYDVSTGRFIASKQGRSGGESFAPTGEYCATLTSDDLRLPVVVCGVSDGSSLAFSRVTEVRWVSDRRLNGNERVVELPGLGLALVRGANVLALDDNAKYNFGDERKIKDVIDALSIRAAEWEVIEEQLVEPPVGGAPPLFGGAPEVAAAWEQLVDKAVAHRDRGSGEAMAVGFLAVGLVLLGSAAWVASVRRRSRARA